MMLGVMNKREEGQKEDDVAVWEEGQKEDAVAVWEQGSRCVL